MSKWLNKRVQDEIISLVVTAGKTIRKMTEPKVLASKGFNFRAADIVTQADIDTENFLHSRLGKLFPDFGFYSEETFKTTKAELSKDYVWVLDPIDGTLNFSRGLPLYGISLALMYKQHPLFGVIYFPEFKEIYTAVAGQGAFCNHQRLRVSQPATVSGAFGTWGGVLNLSSRQTQALHKLAQKQNWALPNTFCCVHHLAQVAHGRYDFTLHFSASLWDYAAGWLLIEEAQGAFEVVYIDEKRQKLEQPFMYWFVGGSQPLVAQIAPQIKRIVYL